MLCDDGCHLPSLARRLQSLTGPLRYPLTGSAAHVGHGRRNSKDPTGRRVQIRAQRGPRLGADQAWRFGIARGRIELRYPPDAALTGT